MGRISRHSRSRTAAARVGFTLAEALLASTVLAIVSATASLPFAAGVQQANEAAKLEQAVALGEGMMEEILARPFSDPQDPAASPGPEADETSRDEFDNIDDFHGYSESSGNLRNFKNAAILDASAEGFWRTVTVEYVTFPDQDPSDVDSLVHIQVLVYHDSALLVTLDRLACREN